jgi:hypothetical protein
MNRFRCRITSISIFFHRRCKHFAGLALQTRICIYELIEEDQNEH